MDDMNKLKNFLKDLDCELTEDELAVISCLNDHLIDYMPKHKKDDQSVNSEINRVIDNYRLMAFESLLLNKRISDKYSRTDDAINLAWQQYHMDIVFKRKKNRGE